MRYSCISPTSRRYDADDLHGHHAGHGRYDRADTVITVTEFTFRTHRRIWRNNRVRSPCAIFSSAAARVSRSTLRLRQSAEFCSAVHGIDPDAAFQLLLYFSGEFFQTTFAHSSAFGSSTSGMVSFMVRSMYAADDAHGSQRTAAHGQHGPTTGTTDTVNVRLRIHRDIVVTTRLIRSTSRPRAATSVAIRCPDDHLSVVPVSAHAAPGSVTVQRGAIVAVTLKSFCHFQVAFLVRTKIIAASKSSASRNVPVLRFYAYPRRSSSSG